MDFFTEFKSRKYRFFGQPREMTVHYRSGCPSVGSIFSIRDLKGWYSGTRIYRSSVYRIQRVKFSIYRISDILDKFRSPQRSDISEFYSLSWRRLSQNVFPVSVDVKLIWSQIWNLQIVSPPSFSTVSNEDVDIMILHHHPNSLSEPELSNLSQVQSQTHLCVWLWTSPYFISKNLTIFYIKELDHILYQRPYFIWKSINDDRQPSSELLFHFPLWIGIVTRRKHLTRMDGRSTWRLHPCAN